MMKKRFKNKGLITVLFMMLLLVAVPFIHTRVLGHVLRTPGVRLAEQPRQTEMLSQENENSQLANDTVEGLRFEYGFDPDDHWIERECSLYIPAGNSGLITLDMYYPFEVTGSLAGTISVNDVVYEFAIESENTSVTVQGIPFKTNHLVIQSPFAKEPGEIDKRMLAFVLTEIYAQEEPADLVYGQTDDRDSTSELNDEAFTIVANEHLPSVNSFSVDNTSNREVFVARSADGWDSVDVLNPSVVAYRGQYYCYYSGFDGALWHTGLATSDDGEKWEKYADNPVLSISGNLEDWDCSYIAANGSAIVNTDNNNEEQIWYYYHGCDADGTPRIGLAVSNDGMHFVKQGMVLSVGKNGTCDEAGVADPYVIRVRDKLYMYYLGMNDLGVQRLCVAVSTDGRNWTKSAANPIMDIGVVGAFDENGLGEPSVIYEAPYFYMLYTGRSAEEKRNIGLAISLDGVNWKKYSFQGLLEQRENEWDSMVICDTTFIEHDDGMYVYYGGGDKPEPAENLNGQIGRFKVEFPQTPYEISLTELKKSASAQDIISGAYDIGEDDAIWVSETLRVILKNQPEASELVLDAYIPMEMHQAQGCNELVLEIWLNDTMVCTKRITGADIYTISLPKEGVQQDEYLFLEVRANHSVNQKKLGIGEDERDLSWMLRGITQP